MAAAQGLDPLERIHKRADFVRLQSSPAIRVRGPGFLLLGSPSQAGPGAPTRIGIVASRKVGNAIARNRAKRLLRELFRKNKAAFPVSYDLVFIALAGLERSMLADLEVALPQVSKELRRRVSSLPRRLAQPSQTTQAAPESSKSVLPGGRESS